MEHANALKDYAVERYLLGEMTDSQKDEFEAHYFECRECGEELRAASAFLDNYRQVAAEEPVVMPAPSRQRDWFAWLRWTFLQPALTGALALFIGYQSFYQIPKLQNLAQAPVVEARLDLGARGDADVVVVPKGERIQFAIPINPSQWAETYQVTVTPVAGGKPVAFTAAGPARDRASSLRIMVPVDLASGVYDVALRWPPNGTGSARITIKSE